jgi:hypothetical protein
VKQHKGPEITVAAILAADPSEDPVDEPKVSESERRLHGDCAPIVQLLREASYSTRAAYVLACKRRREHRVIQDDLINKVQTDALDAAVEETWKAKVDTWLAFQDVAAIPPQLFRQQD